MKMSSFSQSSVLFVRKDGTSMTFQMAPCPQRAELKPLVEHGAGILSSKANEGSVRLVPAGVRATSENCLKASYITDCVDQNKQLPMADYRLRVGEQYNVASSDGSDVEFPSPGKEVKPYHVKQKSGRSRYLLSEENAIIAYLLEHRNHHSLSGNMIWKDMEMLEITGHSWQSMKDHYRRAIQPHLASFNLSAHQIALLTGQLTHHVAKSPGGRPTVEKFMEATSKKKSRAPTSPLKSKKGNGDLVAQTDPLMGKNPQVSLTRIDKDLSNDAVLLHDTKGAITTPNLSNGSDSRAATDDDEDMDSLDAMLLTQAKNSAGPSDEGQEALHSSKSRKISRLGSSPARKARRTNSPKSGTERMGVESDEGNINNNCPSNGGTTSPARHIRSKQKEPASDEVPSPARDTRSKHKHKDTDTPTRKTRSKSSNDRPLSSPGNVKNDSSRSRSRSGKDAVNGQSQKTARAKETDSPARSSPRHGKESVLRESRRSRKTRGARDTEDKESQNEGAMETGTNLREDEEDSQSILPQSPDAPVFRSPSIWPKQSRPIATYSGRKGNKLRDFVFLESQSPSGTQASEESQLLTQDEDNDEEISEAHAILEKVCSCLQLTPKELLSTLHATNGSLPNAISWIMGVTEHVVHWSSEDDAKLLGDDEEASDEVLEKMGQEEAAKRMIFLTEWAE